MCRKVVKRVQEFPCTPRPVSPGVRYICHDERINIVMLLTKSILDPDFLSVLPNVLFLFRDGIQMSQDTVVFVMAPPTVS